MLLLRGHPIGNIKGVLFDKDGTLSDSELHLRKLSELRIQHSISLFSERFSNPKEISRLQELLSAAYGVNSKGLNPGGTIAVASREQNLFSTATVFCILGESWPQALLLANEVFEKVDVLAKKFNNNERKMNLLPGVKELFCKLKAAKVSCALISNDTSRGIESFLEFNNLNFIITHFSSAENNPSKPNPDAVKQLCDQMGVYPADCALFGDADSDLRMAKQAGIELALGYIAGWSHPPKLTTYTHLISHWDEISVELNPKVPSKSHCQ